MGRVITDIDSGADALRLGLTQPAEPVLRSGGPEVGRISDKLVSLLEPESCAADQYRTLRHTVERLRKESGHHVFGVTSPCPGDGKTVTTLNLAGALAQSCDARVLVVDGDLRRPSVGSYLALGHRRSPGLAGAIANPDYELPDVVRRLDALNLSVLPAGAPHASPYELLNSARLDALLREARRQYEWVLIDTPPAVPLPDCRLMERVVDAFLLVIAAHKTPRRLVADALNLLEPTKVAGVVFNADDRSRRNDYYYDYYASSTRETRSSWLRHVFHPFRPG